MITLRHPFDRAGGDVGRGTTRSLPGLLAGAALVAAITAVIALVDRHVPVLGLSVLYLFAVLPIAIFWGLALAIAVSVASMLAFNFFFLPPHHTFTLQDSSNWFALGVFLVTAVVVSELAARSRRRATESALLAEIAGSLLERGEVSGELERIARRGGPRAAGRAGADRARRGHARCRRIEPSAARGRPPGRDDLAREPAAGGRGGARRLLPALASLLGVAIDRERLAQEALEAEALRRSDAMKTAVLRAVSHDLRTPLMAILTSASALARGDLELDQEDERELVATILGAAERLDRLIGNLLDLSRLEAGAAQPRARASGQWTTSSRRRSARPARPAVGSRSSSGGAARGAGRRRSRSSACS